MNKPKFNIVKELQKRQMLQDITPEAEKILQEKTIKIYLGIDPTADSLHIGHLAAIFTMRLFQKAGHQPIFVIGGATGMIGDPSGKSQERKLLTEETIQKNQKAIEKQLKKIINFDSDNKAIFVNNYDWTKNYSLLGFLRDIGKHITVNYMLSKESVKKRINSENGISFTEFSYQLLQAYDFYYLFKEHQCSFQLGGSDQWGNITTGIELIRKKLGKEAYGITIKLITRSDGKKFGKTEKGNVWLDPNKTSPYEFYQFFINLPDQDAEKLLKIYSSKDLQTIEQIIQEHKKEPHKRILQKKLAEELTETIHGKEELKKVIDATQILFGKGTKETIAALDEKTFLSIFEGVPHFQIDKETIENGINIVELLAVKTSAFNSKSEVRRLIKEKGLSLNQTKIDSQDYTVSTKDLINNKYLLFKKGKKHYILILIS